MNTIRTGLPRSIRQVGRLLVLAWVAAGCVRWVPQNLPVAPVDPGTVEGRVRVQFKNGTSLEMRNVRVTADSVLGESGSDEVDAHVGVARKDIANVLRLQVSAKRTFGLIAGVPLLYGVAYGILATISCAQGAPHDC